jgi:hypothetical protein
MLRPRVPPALLRENPDLGVGRKGKKEEGRRVRSTETTSTGISNTATVVFDVNPPISTPTWSNTIDNTKQTIAA